MGLKLYDTMRREKVDFKPIDPSNVRMYACGPTVYDFAHIGNGRSFIAFDLLFRVLRHIYGEAHVKYARNITDIEDKINERAARDYPDLPLNEAIRRVTELTNAQFQTDVLALGCLSPSVQPRATEHIAEMIAIIERLIANGHAYAAEGHVLFNVPSDAHYGELSRRPLDDMIAGARIEVAPYKRDPMDFVLWKPSSDEEPGWDSPWGRGRPGWHIECSAMSWKHLGEVFDIHAGGIDLTFPHHENELAQNRGCFGHSVMANVWVHNGFLQVEGDKMSKSLGNFVTINELIETKTFDGRSWDGSVLRFALLRSHYRQPVDLTAAGLHEAERTLLGFDALVGAHPEWRASEPPEAFVEALHDDLNTPAALAELFPVVKALRAGEADAQDGGRFLAAMALLGVDMGAEARERRARPVTEVDAGRVEALISARLAARKAKNFAEGDRIRDELAAMGVKLKDGKDPATGEPVTTWEVAR